MDPANGSNPGLYPAPALLSDSRLPSAHELVIASVVKQVTGAEATSFDPILGRGMSNNVVIVTTTEGRLVVRLNEANHLSNFEKEAWCLDRASEQGIPVPRVIGCGIERDRAFSIARYIEGSSSIDPDMDRLRIWKTLGLYASKLNAIHLAPGDLNSPASAWFNQSWEDIVSSELELSFGDNFWERSGILTSSQVTNLRSSLESLAHLNAPRGICQIDMGCGNALIQDGDYEKVYLVDLELTIAAPVPHYQLSCVARDYGLSSEIMQSFCAGYQISKDALNEILPDLERLTVLRTMRQAGRSRQKNGDSAVQETENARKLIFDLMAEQLG